MANTLANTSIYKADLSGFAKPPAPKKQGDQNFPASGYLSNAPAFQQVAMGMANWNSPQAETQARYGGQPSSSSSSKSSAKVSTQKSTLPTPPSSTVKKPSSIYRPPAPTIPGASPLDEFYKNTPPKIKAEVEPKVATTTTPVIDITKKKDDVYTPVDYSFIDNLDMKGLKNLQRSYQYDLQQGKTLTKDQQLQMLYAQDRIGDLTTQQTMQNPINPMIEQQEQAKLQRQKELEAEQNQLISAQQENERQYIESQNILFQQAEAEQKNVMGYILGGQGAETSSYGAEQINKIGKNFAAQKQSLLAESNARIQKYRAELSGATREELNNYDKNIQQLQLQSAQFDFDNLKAVNEFNIQEGKDLASKFGALYETSLLQERQKTPLTEDEIAQAGYYSNFLVKSDGSIDNNVLSLLEKTNPLLINSAIKQGVEIQKARMDKGGDYSFSNLGGGQIAVQDPKTGKVTFIQGNKQNEYDYQKDSIGNVYAVNKNDPSDVKLVVEDGLTTPTDAPSTDITSFLKKWEGFRENAYQDSAGVWTVGYGFTTLGGKPVKQGDTIDRGTADLLLQDKIGKYQNRRNFITVPLSQDQETALTSFEYNLGQGIRQTTGTNIINSINNGDVPGAISIIKQHINAGGKPIKGLVNRRNEEAKLLQNTQGGDNVSSGVNQGQINLSSTGKAAFASKSYLGLTGDPKNKLIEELTKSGAFDMGEGNAALYTATPLAKEEISMLLNGYDKWTKALAIINKGGTGAEAYVGPIDSKKELLKRYLGLSSSDSNDLNNILQTELSNYMMKISGATVPEAEVERLTQQLPNVNDSDTNFVDKVKLYDLSMKRGIEHALTKYGFKDIETAKKVIRGSTPTPTTTPKKDLGILANPNNQTTITNVDNYLKNLGY